MKFKFLIGFFNKLSNRVPADVVRLSVYFSSSFLFIFIMCFVISKIRNKINYFI